MRPAEPVERFTAASTRSPSTALAVGRPPAPRPYSMISPAAAPSTNTALKLPRTEARGCRAGSMAGWTRTASSGSGPPSPSSVRSTTATGFTTCPNRAAISMSWAVTAVMPSQATSAAETQAPWAMVAMMAALAPASRPSTSAAGSGLGVSQALGLAQGLVVGGTRLGHLGEDVVGGAVDDAHHPLDRLAHQRLPQGSDEGHRPAHRRLEQQVDAGRVGGGEQLGPVVGQQFLVGRDHRLFEFQGPAHQRPGPGRCRP